MRGFFDATLLKFLLVGIVNTLIGAGVMFLLYNVCGVGYWPASAANYAVGGVVSFILNKFFTFQNTRRSLGQVVRFLATLVVCYAIAYGLAKPLAVFVLSSCPVTVQENGAMFVGMIIYTLLNYIGQRFFAFAEVRQ